MAKVSTEATNFMKFCAGSTDGMTLAVGVSSVECAASVGRMCNRSREGVVGGGLLVVGQWH